MGPGLRCRHCAAELTASFVDLGLSPLSNSYLAAEDLARPERFFPLHVRVCAGCWLVQLPAAVDPEAIFRDYLYFSSYSDSWLAHARSYAAAMSERFALGPASSVIEVASNDGYLLRWFRERGVPVLGIEPARNVAAVAAQNGIPTVTEFFGTALAERLRGEGRRADLLLGNNVLAHVPDINDFAAGLAVLLAPGGVVTMEFPHLLRLIAGNQFDTIYHEHYSYLSLIAVERIFAAAGLVVFDVDELPTHGGSLRVYARHRADPRPVSERVPALIAAEERFGLTRLDRYAAFSAQVQATRRRLLRFLIDAREAGKTAAGYGAPAKGNTLLNYCGIRDDLLAFTVDRSPHKQGRWLPGTRIPIHAPERLREVKPDYVLILPWNLRDEIVAQMAEVRSWGGAFVVAIPGLEVLA